MEVIPLDDRVRSTTVLNTATPSDFTTVYHDNYEIDADALAEDDLAADAAANEGMWTRRNKLLLSLIAGSALLCAIATGSGVAAHRARVANLNSCPAGMVPNVGATPDPSPPTPAKSSKSPTAKSSKSPTAKSSKSTLTDPTETRMLTGATVPATVNEEEGFVGGAYYPSVPKTVEDKRKNRMLVEHLGQRDASSTLSWRLKNLGEMMMNFGGDEEKEQQQRLNYERRLATKSSKSPSTKSSKSPTAKSSKSGDGGSSIVEGLKPSTDNCKCVNSGLNGSSSNGNGGSGAKSSKSPSTKSSKSPSTKSSKSPTTKSSKSPTTKSSKSPSTKSSKSPTAKSSKSSGGRLTSPLAPTACNAPVAPLVPVPNPVAPGGKSSKSPTSKTGKSTRLPVPGIVEPTPVNPPAVVKPPAPATKRPTASVIPPPATTETKSPTPCTVDCPGVPVVDPTPPTPSGGGGDKTPSPTRGGEGENPSVPEPTPPTPGTEDLTPPVPTPSTPNCDNDGDWESAAGDSCDDVADGDANVLCVTASSVGGTSASEACPAACNTECLTNCDNDEAWESTDGESCAVVAEDPIGLCKSAVNGSGESATTACPASCNKECFVNCDNDPLWIGVLEGETCDDVAENTKGLCGRLNSELVAASEACPAACNPECFPPTIDVPVTFPTGFPKLDSYVPTPEITVGVTVTVGEEDKTPPTPTPSRVVVTPMPTNIGTSIGSSVGSSGGTITVSTETTGPPTLAIREDEQGDDEEVR